jgi:hypothetical protein
MQSVIIEIALTTSIAVRNITVSMQPAKIIPVAPIKQNPTLPNQSPVKVVPSEAMISKAQAGRDRQAAVAKAQAAIKMSNDAKDLEAQQQMAFWACLMFVASVIQAVGLAITVVFAYFTARDGRRAAIAATKAVDLASVTARQQLRAYVGVERCSFELGAGNVPKFEVVLRNAGQTPAIGMIARVSVVLRRIDKDLEMPALSYSELNPQEVLPGRSMPLTIRGGVISGQNLTVFKTGKQLFFMRVACKYVDAFGYEHEFISISSINALGNTKSVSYTSSTIPPIISPSFSAPTAI